MKIGIFSKFQMAGGSEFRSIELCNGINNFSSHDCILLVDSSKLKPELLNNINHKDKIVYNCFDNKEEIYNCDCLIIINTDSKEFSKISYWKNKKIDISMIKKMVFIYNFIISPSENLHEFEKYNVDIRICAGNQRFLNELTNKDKLKKVKHLPRIVLESPINKDTIYQFKTPSDKIRIGKHSKPFGDKWNDEHYDLIKMINDKYEDRIIWDFMGTNKEFNESLKSFKNVILREQFTLPVSVYLMNLDIFLFYPKWNRQECWARSVAEGLLSGCPVLATDVDGGNRMQIVDGSNGYLCKNLDMFYEKLEFLINNKHMIDKLGKNAKLYGEYL
jgi:glycosyltransferase involved in cell wall biosynthesis